MLEARELLASGMNEPYLVVYHLLNAGEWVQITGSNGAGKTTLLRLLTGCLALMQARFSGKGSPCIRYATATIKTCYG